jgi:ATP-dependent helicase HepA
VAFSSFVPGQRWVSNTESELGLGIVSTVANRRVEISFPAAGEIRTYAMDNAPLSRVHYDVGQQVTNQDDKTFTIEEVLEKQGCFIYRASDEAGQSIVLPEMELSCFVHFSKPQDRLFAGQIDKNKAFQLRRETLGHVRQQQLSPVNGLLGPRVQLLPHQLYIAHEIANRYAPRVLLADEVGLGKTIEAGLILHHQLITGRAQRILIVVPDSLLHQWLVEMLRRFNLFFTILDEERCQALEGIDPDEADNPFESAQLVLCTLSFLTEYKERQQQAVAADWDLLVVDEAHHLQWSEAEASPSYQTIERLAQQSKGLLLLTATPEQLGVESHFARLRLLDSARYFDLQTFLKEEEHYQPVNALVQQLLNEESERVLADQKVLQTLEGYLGATALASMQALLEKGQAEEAVQAVIKDLLDRHGTGRVLFRNTRSSVAGFPERELHTYPLAMSEGLAEQVKQADLSESLCLEQLSGKQWVQQDARVEWLVNWLKQMRSEKVLIICARAETALDLEAHLRVREAVNSAVFHEGLSLVARDRAAAYFADDEDGAQVLICSEIGSEGRNFQFAHNLVLFDLPLNPDLLEQRIGRLDRIGQRNTVKIHVPYYQDSAQGVLLQWYHEGINAFKQACPAGQNLFEFFSQSLNHCLLNGDDHDALTSLIEQTQTKTAETLQALQQGRDRLLELNSCNPERADEVLKSMVSAERRQELETYMGRVFDQYGVDQEYHSAASIILHPSDHMLQHDFPSLPEEGMTATFQRELALSREDIHYLTWEHPMVTGAIDMVLNSDFGNTAFCTLKLPPLKAGTLLLEAVFVMRCSAPASVQVHRYLPLTMIRVVVDSNQHNLSKVLKEELIDKLSKKVPRRSAQDLVRHARTEIANMVKQAEQVATEQQQPLVEQAVEKMQQSQNSEIQRLAALAQVNANIRQEEMDYLQQETEALQRYLQSAQLQLDSVRVAVVTD